MNEPKPAKPSLRHFPLGQSTAKDVDEHQTFLAWIRLHYKPRFTMATRWAKPRLNNSYVFYANNGAKIGFADNPILELVYLHPESKSWFHIDLQQSAIKNWRSGDLPDDEFKFARRWMHTLPFRLMYWRLNLPDLLEYLGCSSDLRLITTLTVILNYKPASRIPPASAGHISTEQHTFPI
jgi:hypothetical protein